VSLTAVYTIWLREVKIFLRARSRLVGSVVTPFFWLAILGMGFRASFDLRGVPVDYLDFMAPGIIGMSLLFSSMFSGISVLWERQFGFLKEILVAPVGRSSIVLGKTLGGSTVAVSQGVILLLLSLGMGVGISGIWEALLSLPVMVLISASFINLGLAFASRMEDPHGFQTIMGFVMLPLFFLSGALFPVIRLPPLLRGFAYVDPLTYGVDALRGLLIGVSYFPLWSDLLAVIAFLFLTTVLATALFERMV
jgi:ABC-2 type transport system permease protein